MLAELAAELLAVYQYSIMTDVLIIDDEEHISRTLADVIGRLGYRATFATNLEKGLQEAQTGKYAVVILDVRLPDGNGLEALPQLRAVESEPEVIILTGIGDPDGAELAIRNGAWDYLVKPSSLHEIKLAVNRALEFHEQKTAVCTPVVLKRDNIIGRSPKMKAAMERLAQAAASRANVLIQGETGTGKELFARAIHENSSLGQKPFVVLDCAAIPETLVEDILFGHEKGAFTGADRTTQGQILQAHGGTLFLDEVGELPLSAQKAFLRVIQERRVRPVSGKREFDVEFRLIAATNRGLDEEVKQGRFRSDLLFRLRAVTIELPPLRDRREDLRDLTIFFADGLCQKYGMETKGFSSDFFQVFSEYSWPGNVRELINALEDALSAARNSPTLYPIHLPTHIRARLVRSAVEASAEEEGALIPEGLLDDMAIQGLPVMKDFKHEMEHRYLGKLMKLSNGSKKKACELSGLSRTRLFELLKKYDMS
jgi:two-component system NtrC family response regulator